MTRDPLFILAALGLNIAISEWLARHTKLRHLGSALLVIVLTAVTANLGWIPPASEPIAVYDAVFSHVAPLAIFWLLLQVQLRGLLRAGVPMLLLFSVGAIGTTSGVLLGMWAVGGEIAFGEFHHALGGMFVGTYTGGSVNFNALALHYGVAQEGLLYAGASVVDSGMTTIWMAVTVALPRLIGPFWPRSRTEATAPATSSEATSDDARLDDGENVHPFDLGVVIALGLFAVWGSRLLQEGLARATGVSIPWIIILTSTALVLAQLPIVQRLRGTRVCGMLAVMLFLAVIGALCDVSALRAIGELGKTLMLFVVVVVGVHGVVVFVVAGALRLDPETAAVASQANIGGSTSALALARSFGRADLVLPGILVGSLGNAVGTYLGALTAYWLQ